MLQYYSANSALRKKKKKSHSTRMDPHRPGHSGNTLESPGELSRTFQHRPIKGELLGPSPGPERHPQPRLRYSERLLVIYPSLPLSYFIFQSIPPSGLSESFFEGNFVFFFLQSFPPKSPGQFRSCYIANGRFTAVSAIGTEFIPNALCAPAVKTDSPIWGFSLAKLLRQR